MLHQVDFFKILYIQASSGAAVGARKDQKEIPDGNEDRYSDTLYITEV